MRLIVLRGFRHAVFSHLELLLLYERQYVERIFKNFESFGCDWLFLFDFNIAVSRVKDFSVLKYLVS